MISIEFHFRASSLGREHLGRLFIRLIHKRKVRNIATGLRLYLSEWDASLHSVVYRAENSSRFLYLKGIEQIIYKEKQLLKSIVKFYELRGDYTVIDIANAYRRRKSGNPLLPFAEKLASELLECGCDRTARAYKTVAKGLIRFSGNQSLSLSHITPVLLRRFENYMRSEGKSLNTISFYMRNLRAIYNKAIKERLIEPRLDNPFENVYTGVYVTRKRALTKEEMKLLNTPLISQCESDPYYKVLEPSLRFFLFSFHGRGISFIDLAFLKKENIKENRITYYRKKTGQMLEITINPLMRDIIRSFEKEVIDSPYLFPIIRKPGANERRQYENALRLQNNHLKRLAKKFNINKRLSTHVARHTWATIAKGEHLPLAVISEGLGHTSEKTTAIYLASFDHSIMHKAAERVSKAIKFVG